MSAAAVSLAQREQLVAFARAQAGKRYVLGGAGPDVWDCSGLVMRAWERVGVQLRHHAAFQYLDTHRIYAAGLSPLPGDLVFYYRMGHLGRDAPHHVAMIGDGKVWYRGRRVFRIIQATDESHGVQAGLPINYYADPIAYGRPDFAGWDSQ